MIIITNIYRQSIKNIRRGKGLKIYHFDKILANTFKNDKKNAKNKSNPKTKKHVDHPSIKYYTHPLQIKHHIIKRRYKIKIR